MDNTSWLTLSGAVKQGYRIASGMSEKSSYPYGTIEMQIPFFSERGLDLSTFYKGTLNISIEPFKFKIVKPEITFRDVCWTDIRPAEHFSFSRCKVVFKGVENDCWIYYPHPETKRQHFQDPSTLEVIAPHLLEISYGAKVELKLNSMEIFIEPSPT